MTGLWKISGEFYGWISENGSFYNSNGRRSGTMNNNILYNHRGNYIGELINENFIGYNQDRNFLQGPECYLDEEIYLEPLPDREQIDVNGFRNPN